ncbi:MAG: hypothetical protein PHF86_00525 [Candidatus Nanoarchaeia archaeon]|nr:hypothetical protein [Candidatus Nanoarchaeia archaeon]
MKLKKKLLKKLQKHEFDNSKDLTLEELKECVKLAKKMQKNDADTIWSRNWVYIYKQILKQFNLKTTEKS